MNVSRRTVLAWIGARSAAALTPVAGVCQPLPVHATGPYTARWDSLQQHACPDWYRDAKFGIYFHWGLYSVPAFGNEWYPHWMYLPGRPEYEHHVATYGTLDKFGYKDFASQFTAEHFDADAWVTLFRESGARYVGPVAEHADGFSMWASRINRWNAARMGPRRDIVGEMERAVRKQGLKFYASFHHQWLWGWYSSPVASADIYNPEFADLYWPQKYAWGTPPPKDYSPDRPGAFNYAHPVPPPSPNFCEIWRDKVIEVIDRYHPDILYFDTRSFIIPESYRLEMLAHYYNASYEAGREVTITYKENDFAKGSGLPDFEAGQLAEKASFVWQTDDVMDWDSWAYLRQPNYKTAGRIVHQLIDIVSKNGNMLLDVGPRPDGTIPEEIVSRLQTIGAWLEKNGEAIYGTRPWERFGEGPTRVKEGMYVADHNTDFTAQDLRFTTRNKLLYVHVLGDPGTQVIARSIRRDTPLPCGSLTKAEMPGFSGALQWDWSADGLVIRLPERKPSEDAVVIRLS
jgi:alpha-L-fucosidase